MAEPYMKTEPFVTHAGRAKVRLKIGSVSIALDLNEAEGMAQGLLSAAQVAETMANDQAEIST